METTTFELRKLEAKDIAPMASIVNKIGWKQFKAVFQSDDGKDMTDLVPLLFPLACNHIKSNISLWPQHAVLGS